jgi:molecular chaperone DnaK (HSP70)
VTATSGLTEDEIRRMAREAADYALDVKDTSATEALKAEVAALIRDVDAILPQVRTFMSGSDFGKEALSKAEGALDKAKEAAAGRSADALKQAKEPLERTLRMLRGVAQKMG